MSLALLMLLVLAPPNQAAPGSTRRDGCELLRSAHQRAERSLALLELLSQRLEQDPDLVRERLPELTEEPRGDRAEREGRLRQLESEVLRLRADLAACSELAASRRVAAPAAPVVAPVPPSQTGPAAAQSSATPEPSTAGAGPYSADPLHHGIACYRSGHYEEALELLGPLDQAEAHYWRARALERLERLDEAIAALERALSASEQPGVGFDPRRARTDLEFVRWKRDFRPTSASTPSPSRIRRTPDSPPRSEFP